MLAEKIDEDSAVLEAPVPVRMAVLLPIVKTAELDELRTEGVVMPADAVGPNVLVALPVGKMAEVLELEELKTEEVMVLLSELRFAELEELRADEAVALADAVGPKVTVALPVGNMAEVLETEESVELPRRVVLSTEADGVELRKLLTEKVTELEKETAEELASMDD